MITSTVRANPAGDPLLSITTEGASGFEEASNVVSAVVFDAMASYPGVAWTMESSWDDTTSTALSFVYVQNAVEVISDPEALRESVETGLEDAGHTTEPPIVLLSGGVSATVTFGPSRLVNQGSLRGTIAASVAFLADLFVPPIGGGISETDHDALRQLIHFLDDGPGSGFASGAYREALPAASPFPTSETWWDSSSKTYKIVELLITRGAGGRPTVETWKVYSASGTLLATVTDAISYSGPFETSRTRSMT